RDIDDFLHDAIRIHSLNICAREYRIQQPARVDTTDELTQVRAGSGLADGFVCVARKNQCKEWRDGQAPALYVVKPPDLKILSSAVITPVIQNIGWKVQWHFFARIFDQHVGKTYIRCQTIGQSVLQTKQQIVGAALIGREARSIIEEMP